MVNIRKLISFFFSVVVSVGVVVVVTVVAVAVVEFVVVVVSVVEAVVDVPVAVVLVVAVFVDVVRVVVVPVVSLSLFFLCSLSSVPSHSANELWHGYTCRNIWLNCNTCTSFSS